MPVLKDWLTAEQLAVIDDYLPEKLTMANGRRSRLTYAKEGPPVLSARIQELYGIEGKFKLHRFQTMHALTLAFPVSRVHFKIALCSCGNFLTNPLFAPYKILEIKTRRYGTARQCIVLFTSAFSNRSSKPNTPGNAHLRTLPLFEIKSKTNF